MSFSLEKLGSSRRFWWSRIRFQLGIGFLLAVLLPSIIRIRISQNELVTSPLQNSVVGTTLALILGYYGFRRLSRFPGVRASYFIAPSFLVSYGLILAAFFFLRLDYSRLQFLASFVLCAIWFYFLHFKIERRRHFRMGVVPFGEVESLYRISGVSWIVLAPENRDSRFDAIVADLRADIPDEWERFIADKALEGVLVMHVKQMQESLTGRVEIEHLSENNLGSLIPGVIYAKVKWVWEFGAALLLLPLLAPFLLLTALLIRIDSPGPILYRQERMGYRGRLFRMWKFRTMEDGPDVEEDVRTQSITQTGDKRVTRIGKYLRKYRIDELPQLVNILKGEMSWIGPRPEAVPLSRWYEEELPFYRYRHIVRPGISGWAQVKQGHVAEVEDVLRKLQYDFYYIRNFSFWLDLLIVARTFRTILTGFGSR